MTDEVVNRRVASEIDDALQRCMERLDRLVDRGDCTKDEIRESLNFYPDFCDAFDEWEAESS